MSFSEAEIAYLRSQRLARIATVSADGQPDVVPVGFEFDGTYVYVGGVDLVVRPRHRPTRHNQGEVT
ncbi:pyridoxamine 5'-phosphate oxidase family protein [Streptosporangium soli]|nr:pyridoxamine 5'-phosphate oxidase family protein [Streptosporangium sp. KLBMP 9127]